MHNVYKRPVRKMTAKEYQQELDYYYCGNNIANHMAYIYMLTLYDKMGWSAARIEKWGLAIKEVRTRLQDDNDTEITNEYLLDYAKSKGLDVYNFVLSIPRSEKLYLADMKKGFVFAAGAVDSGFLMTLIITIYVFKRKYHMGNAKIEEFLKWVAYGIKMYSTKLPKEKGMVFSDEYIRQIFIEDEHYDVKKGEKTA